MNDVLVSIIIPVYNRQAQIQEALNSVIAQTYPKWECLVVDDGSTDTTLEVLKTYREQDQRIQYFTRNRLPKGAPTCRNIGLAQTKGDYVIYLDSDDYLLPFCLEQRVRQFQNHPDCHFMVFTMAEKRGDHIKPKELPEQHNYLELFLSANLPWSIMSPIWKRSFLLELNGFTEGYPRFNDPELMIRALLQNAVRFKIINDHRFDCVYIPSPKSTIDFNTKVYEGLCLFIPDISKALQLANKAHLKQHLALYLHLWFKYFYTDWLVIKLRAI